MDQLKQTMRVLVQHRFWVLSGLITLIGLGIWYMATSALDKEFNDQKSKIEGQYSKVKQVLDIPNHPNDFLHKRMDEINADTRDRVYQAWLTQWERQLAVLVWPPELEKDFDAVVSGLRPAEAIAFPTPREKEIGIQYRTRYRDYIQTVLPNLAKIINSNWDAKMGGGGTGGGGAAGFGGFGGGAPGGAGGPGGMAPDAAGAGAPGGGIAGAGTNPNAGEDEPTYVVQWNAGNQTAIASKYDWSARSDNMPKTLEILYAQEDLWILTSLMHVIARTNDGADARYKAAIKQIVSIDLGAAAQRGGNVQRPGAAGGEGGMGMGMPGMPGAGAGGAAGAPAGAGGGAGGSGAPAAGGSMGMAGMPGMPGMPGAGGAGAGGGGGDPLDNRYVDVDLQPLKGQRIREALNVRDPKDALLAVVKRMPVRLQLVVDIRRLNRLLAECGNSDLPLEIRQVRINRQGAASGGMGGGGMGGMGGMPAGMGGGMGGGAPGGMADAGAMGGGGAPGGGMPAGMMGGGGGRGRAGGAVVQVEDDNYETKVELFGLIYLFNPVNEAKLGTPQRAAAPAGASAGTAPAGAPVTTPTSNPGGAAVATSPAS